VFLGVKINFHPLSLIEGVESNTANHSVIPYMIGSFPGEQTMPEFPSVPT